LAKFDSFQTLDDPQLKMMKKAAVEFADDLFHDRTPRWLSFLGSPGIGKTMLAVIIWHLFRDNRHDRINWPASERTKSEKNPRGRVIRRRGGFLNWGRCINNRMLKGDYDFLDDVCSWDFFVIDDIGTEYEKHRALSIAKLYQIFDARLGKWTVITANFGLQEIGDRLDPRLASRMVRNDGRVLDLDLVDYALR
jgi:DNA replication protein DnaC